MLSPARKLAPRREAVVLRLLACLAFFGCVSAHLVTHADDCDQTQKFAAGQGALLERLHDDTLPCDGLSATEPESPEPDAALEEALPFRLSTQFSSTARFVSRDPRVVYAKGWRPQSISSVVMAQGPP